MKRLALALTLLLVGFGPFRCDHPDVEEARRQLRAAEAEPALTTLADLAADAPEVHLARAIAHHQLKQWEPAKTALDQALRGVAERDARDSAERQLDGLPALPLAARDSADLRARLLFVRGLVALGEERWQDAIVDFGQVLALRPDDEDARWNMELAWHRHNPPCVQRDDDREQDDTRAEAKPMAEPKAEERRLCPADEDWYAIEGKRDMILFATLTGELEPFEEEDTREVTLALYGPDDEAPLRTAPMVDGKAIVGITGLHADGIYHLQVAGPGAAEVQYGIQIDIVPPCPVDDALEDNDTLETAHALADGEQAALKACPGDPDYYTVTVPAGEKRQLQVGFDPARAPLAVERFDALGQIVEAVGRKASGGLVLTLPTDPDNPTTSLVRILPVGDRENTYALKLAPPEENGDENQEQDEQEQDEQEQEQEQEPEPQDEQDQEQQQPEPEEQPPPEPQEAMDLDKLIDAIDAHERNPQLEKALRDLRVVPRLEDY